MAQVNILLFGSPQIFIDGQLIEFARRKSLALAAYLAMTNQRHNRDALAAFFYPESDAIRARAALRRALATINETPLLAWIDADRDTIALVLDENVRVDVTQFNQLLGQATVDALQQAVDLYVDDFMSGFSLRDSAAFDHWQSTQMQNCQHKFLVAMERLSEHYIDGQDTDKAAGILRRWIATDPLHEKAQYSLVQLYAATGQRGMALAQYEAYEAMLKNELGVSPQVETTQLYEAIKNDRTLKIQQPSRALPGHMPPAPTLVIGRESAINDLRSCLGVSEDQSSPLATIVIQGWPGIGKSTLSAMLAHDPDIRQHFSDGVLWASFGQQPNLLAILSAWGRAVGLHELQGIKQIEEASARLRVFLQDKKILFILDDIWAVEHASVFRIGGSQSSLLITTRLNDVSRALADHPNSIYKIPILSEAHSLELLRTLAPEVVQQYPEQSRQLVTDLEGLPLALQVAGRLLHAEMRMGWGIVDLLSELSEGTRLLQAQAPADRAELASETTPTIAVLLQRSIAHLSDDLQERFVLLGVFAPKPATFTLQAMQAVWGTDDVKPSIRKLVDRGLLEPAGQGKFQMHALMVMQAQSMVEGHQ